MIKRNPINPKELYNSLPMGFSHAIESEGGRLLHLAGQVALDHKGELVGGADLAAQTKQVLANLSVVLAEANAGPENVVRLRTYIVDHAPEKLGVIGGALAEFYGNVTPAANTVIGVQALALPVFLIEIEAIAILDS